VTSPRGCHARVRPPAARVEAGMGSSLNPLSLRLDIGVCLTAGWDERFGVDTS
jgi:hypothetical protein